MVISRVVVRWRGGWVPHLRIFLLGFHRAQYFLEQTMHFTSIINELTLVVETFFGEPGDFSKGFARVESDGRHRRFTTQRCVARNQVVLLGHDL